MIRLLALILPILMWLILLLTVRRRHYRGLWLYFGLAGVNVLAIWWSTGPFLSNYLWLVLFCSTLVALVGVILQLIEADDFLIPPYLHWVSRALVFATTIWWVLGFILTI